MNETCKITYNGIEIGSAKVWILGLYYHFVCTCTFPDERIYRLYAHCADRSTALGICVPAEGSFGLSTKIPVSRLGTGIITITAKSKADISDHSFIPVEENAPFSCLEDLDNAVYLDGKITIKGRYQDPQDSGQNP